MISVKPEMFFVESKRQKINTGCLLSICSASAKSFCCLLTEAAVYLRPTLPTEAENQNPKAERAASKRTQPLLYFGEMQIDKGHLTGFWLYSRSMENQFQPNLTNHSGNAEFLLDLSRNDWNRASGPLLHGQVPPGPIALHVNLFGISFQRSSPSLSDVVTFLFCSHTLPFRKNRLPGNSHSMLQATEMVGFIGAGNLGHHFSQVANKMQGRSPNQCVCMFQQNWQHQRTHSATAKSKTSQTLQTTHHAPDKRA